MGDSNVVYFFFLRDQEPGSYKIKALDDSSGASSRTNPKPTGQKASIVTNHGICWLSFLFGWEMLLIAYYNTTYRKINNIETGLL